MPESLPWQIRLARGRTMIIETLLPLGKLDPGLREPDTTARYSSRVDRIEFSTPVTTEQDAEALRSILADIRNVG